jgi:hypothetical protein
MKKVIYIILLSFMSALAITSCTEETVNPKSEEGSGGGGGTSDPRP